MRSSLRILLTLIMVALAIAAGTWLWRYYLYTPWTRDGRVHADVITIAPDVSGWVRTLSVGDTDYVDQGDALFQIDQARYQAALDQAQAEVNHRQATLDLNRAEASRRNRLGNSRAISEENQQIAQINAQVAAADLEQAQASLEAARLDLERASVTAPASGHVLNVQFSEGNYVSRGTPVMALIREESYYVVGYFEETKMASIRVGDPADVTLMQGNTRLNGRVAGIGRGIADANTTLNAQLLPQVTPTFNWVRLAQRIPVRIVLDEVPADTLLSVGMTATVRIHPDDA
ncbi:MULTISPECIES: HlyD family secretion protein [unclassified Halomonas]|uniref:efflux RND transporter periplasmic adaptor subunit n=1 Tax=unclassified Halomonas TaxID=2609666 RepID=UPI0021E39B64|nr:MULTISPECIES: HlyD family secretion protein [unclassified Halomonas]UYG00702.1 HlyD family secretion protein [Halomonas sp. GD1P12]WNL38242.1 HlyD family secretion protein [Halomonas sp. PAMB 3232]WNL41542.1 HlyD family secretion protein [Halomonas sp. PAMB 3264]